MATQDSNNCYQWNGIDIYPTPDATSATTSDYWWTTIYPGTSTAIPTKKILKCSKCGKRIGQIKTMWDFQPEEVLCETCRQIEKLKE